jgi:N-acetylglucosamine-6-phosphate deacetylase
MSNHWLLKNGNFVIREEYVKESKATLDNGTLAGSCLDMEKAYQFLVTTLKLDPTQVFQLMSLNPAKVLGVEQKFGSIENGKVADLVVLNNNRIEQVMIEGNWVTGRTEIRVET